VRPANALGSVARGRLGVLARCREELRRPDALERGIDISGDGERFWDVVEEERLYVHACREQRSDQPAHRSARRGSVGCGDAVLPNGAARLGTTARDWAASGGGRGPHRCRLLGAAPHRGGRASDRSQAP
jgi:hypothetical protein